MRQSEEGVPVMGSRANQQVLSAKRFFIAFVIYLIPLYTGTALAQAGSHFDTASVKITPGAAQGMRVMFDPDHFVMTNTAVLSLIELAYGVDDYQIADVPAWVSSLHVDVEAKVDAEKINARKAPDSETLQRRELDQERLREELKNLLSDRFALKVIQSIDLKPAYLLVLDKHKEMMEASNAVESVQVSPGHLKCSHATMQDLANWLSQAVQRQVVDKTGLSGFYAFTLDWDPTGGMAASTDAERPPDIFTSLKDQLGLRLVAGKAPTPVIHIVNISKPSPN